MGWKKLFENSKKAGQCMEEKRHFYVSFWPDPSNQVSAREVIWF